MKKPYIKKLDEIASITVWIVDGQYVRGRIDEEFTNFGQHFRFRFIPMHEFWIDKEHGLGEEQFFIDHLLIEYRLMTQGMAYDKALEKADAVELKKRRKAELVRQISKLSNKKTIDRRILFAISGRCPRIPTLIPFLARFLILRFRCAGNLPPSSSGTHCSLQGAFSSFRAILRGI